MSQGTCAELELSYRCTEHSTLQAASADVVILATARQNTTPHHLDANPISLDSQARKTKHKAIRKLG